MKKSLSIFLAIIMLLSSFATVTASAESGDLSDVLYSDETVAASEAALRRFKVNDLPAQFSFDFEDRKNEENAKVWNDIDLMGMSLDFLYSSDRPLLWSQLDVFMKDANGNIIHDEARNPILAITRDDVSLVFTNLNIYLQRYFYSKYGGLELHNINNAIKLANTIGKIFNPEFKTLDVNNFRNYFTNEIPSANEFFRAVTTLSGLDKIIAQNWIPQGRAFCEPLVNILGGNFINFYSEYYEDGLVLGSKILEAMVSKFLTVGPVDFIYELLTIFASDSYLIYREPTLALFSLKKAKVSEHISESYFNSFDGLLHLILCDCDPVLAEGCYGNSNEIDHFTAFKFPVERFKTTSDKNEKLIYLYYYLNLTGRYKNNVTYAEKLKKSIADDFAIPVEDKIKLRALVDGFLLGDFDSAIDDAIVPLYTENISTAKDSIFTRLRNAFMVFMKKIADYFDYLRKIFSGELEYGQGNSPFN